MPSTQPPFTSPREAPYKAQSLLQTVSTEIQLLQLLAWALSFTNTRLITINNDNAK
jgi:hypothetical protein